MLFRMEYFMHIIQPLTPTHMYTTHICIQHMYTHTCIQHTYVYNTHNVYNTYVYNTHMYTTHMYTIHICIQHTYVYNTHNYVFQRENSNQPFPEESFLTAYSKGSAASYKKLSRFFGEDPPRVENLESLLDELGYTHLLPVCYTFCKISRKHTYIES